MPWVDLVTLLAVFEFLGLAWLVGKARVRHRVHAPATTGNEHFERWFRVQQNTLETLIMFLPTLWVAAHYWSAAWMALIGVVYLIGRVMYLFGYVRNPHSRSWGYGLSIAPVRVLILVALVGIAGAVFNS